MPMAIIFETNHFLVTAPEKPLVGRQDGGHIVIDPKTKIRDRQQLKPDQAIELMRLTMVAGEAMQTILQINGIPIGRLNYQDNGNWSVFKPGGPLLHIHIYGRAVDARTQPYGQALFFPHRDTHEEFYSGLEPLTREDVCGVRDKMKLLFEEERYTAQTWGFTK
jgi:diadenosine tetraphosphate (Ap4A) HIT family hydrolase